MKKILFYTILILTVLSCVDSKFDAPIEPNCTTQNLSKTKEVSQIYSLATNTAVVYNNDDVIEAYVISSDEAGNFYKNLYLQPTDGSKGFSMSIDDTRLYSKELNIGKKVFVKLKGLSFASPSSGAKGLIFGFAPTSTYAVDRIPTFAYKNYLIASCTSKSENELIHHIALADANNDNYLNTLVQFDQVEFIEECVGEAYDLVRTDTYDGNTFITDGTTKLALRTSQYANFASHAIPTGNGKITGVLTQYGATKQLILRTEKDVDLPKPRITDYPAIEGNTFNFLSAFNENFETYLPTTAGANLPKYSNDAIKGAKYWDIKKFSTNQYLQMAAYGSGGTNSVMLVIPVVFSANKKLSFKTRDGYYNGEVLKVYYTKTYLPNQYNLADLTDITKYFAIAQGTTNSYASNFTSSGAYKIPAGLSGNGYFIFEYSNVGHPEITTTIQLDDVVYE
jgi:hypothetical protein